MPLESDIDEFLEPLIRLFSSLLKTTIEGHLVRAFIQGDKELVTWGKTAGGIPIAYEGPPIDQATKWAKDYGAKLVTNMDTETKSRLAKVISDGIQNKRGIPGISKDLRTTFTDMSKYRSQLIAKTETRQALWKGSRERMDAMGIDGKEWVLGSGGAEGNCPDCIGNSRVGVISTDKEFPIPEGDIHPGCVLPDTMVNPLGLQLMTRAFYLGIVIELHTSGGNRLAITPNHPILTPLGFIAANKLSKGDNVISCLNRDRMLFTINPNYQNIPTSIKEICDSLILTPGMAVTSMKPSPIDFHGDAGAFNGNVDIIHPNGLLQGKYKSSIFEHIGQYYLGNGYSDLFNLSSFSLPFSFNNRTFTPSGCFVGIGSQGFTLSQREFTHPNLNCFAIGSRCNTCLYQPPANDISINSELSRQFKLRFASFITTEQIINVRYYNFSGHVYNLQSFESLYIANNIIVKNCTCAIAPARLSK